MSGLEKSASPQAEKIERFVSLKSGEYWKVLESDPERELDEGEILLLSRIDYVDDQPHTIVIRIHPSKQSSHPQASTKFAKFLVQDFLTKFEHVDSALAKSDREKSLGEIRERLSLAQNELSEASSDINTLDRYILRDTPKEEIEKQLPVIREALPANLSKAIQTSQITDLMVTNLTDDGVQNIMNAMQHHKDVALKRVDWIQKQTRKFTEIAATMTPYVQEQAAQPIAECQDIRDHISELMKGISNLNLYTLKDIEIQTLRKGESAPREEKLTVLQRPLFMDEEAAVWVDIYEDFDFQSRDLFFKTVSENQSLVDQLFPTQRCVVGVSTTRRYIDYSEDSAFERDYKNGQNARLFLMVRDGENVYCVTSNQNDLEFKERLFPSLDDMESPFQGFDGRTITFNDLEYTSSLNLFERTALTYKRFLILFCGLDHNKGLFGDFYDGEPSLNFVSKEFQEDHFNFIHDDDGTGLIANTSRPPHVKKWLAKVNSRISKGSRLLILHDDVMNVRNTPSAFEAWNSYHSYNNPQQQVFEVDTSDDWFVGVVKQKGAKKYITLPLVEYHAFGRQPKEKNGTIDVNMLINNHSGDFKIVCLDRLNVDDAKFYLNDRSSRVACVRHIILLKRIISMIEEERVVEAPVRKELLAALHEGGVAHGEKAEQIIDEAIAITRCANNGKSLNEIYSTTKSRNALLNQMYELSRDKDEIIKLIKEKQEKTGRQTLRISLSEKGKYIVYSAPLEEEVDNRVEPFAWVHCTTNTLSKNGIRTGSGKFAILEKSTPKETILYESEFAADFYRDPDSTIFKSANAKKACLNSICDYDVTNDINLIQEIKESQSSWEDFANAFFEQRRYLTDTTRGKRVISPRYTILVGYNLQKANKKGVFTLGVVEFDPIKALIATAHSEQALFQLKHRYADIYQESETHRQKFEQWKREYKYGQLTDAATLMTIEVNPNEEVDCSQFGWSLNRTYSVVHRKSPRLYSLDFAVKDNDAMNTLVRLAYFKDGFDKVLSIQEPSHYRPVFRKVFGKPQNETSYAAYFEYDALDSLGHSFSQGHCYDTLESAMEKHSAEQETWFVHHKRHCETITADIVEIPFDGEKDFNIDGVKPIIVTERKIKKTVSDIE